MTSSPHTSLNPSVTSDIVSTLSAANQWFIRYYPGESNRRQAVQTVYGGAHLFKTDSAKKLGEVALRSLKEYAPDASTLIDALGMQIDAGPAQKIYDRIVEKLEREPVGDFRLDF